ncbi:MAG: GNAT family N-acetyltransferase [Flavobacteriaceae bacterium]|tara:strand:- start:583 stop:1032 length:450 start_codon:yes stop_codon:yes gene_type:complete
MNKVIKNFSELSTEEIYNILKLRSEVFVVEQNCVYQDIDEKDQKATHLFIEKNNEIIAYTRIFKKGDYYEENPSIGRVVVSKKERGKNLGKEIMLNSIEFIKKELEGRKIELSAQKYLDKFYTDLDFYSEGEDYLEDGIPHQRMFYDLV